MQCSVPLNSLMAVSCSVSVLVSGRPLGKPQCPPLCCSIKYSTRGWALAPDAAEAEAEAEAGGGGTRNATTPYERRACEGCSTGFGFFALMAASSALDRRLAPPADAILTRHVTRPHGSQFTAVYRYEANSNRSKCLLKTDKIKDENQRQSRIQKRRSDGYNAKAELEALAALEALEALAALEVLDVEVMGDAEAVVGWTTLFTFADGSGSCSGSGAGSGAGCEWGGCVCSTTDTTVSTRSGRAHCAVHTS